MFSHRRTLMSLAAAAAFAATALFAACGDDGEISPPTIITTPTPSPFPNVCLPNPDPATPEFQIIDQPPPFSEVKSGFTVSGQVNYFEATYQVALYDADGDAILQDFGTALAEDAGHLAPFSHEVAYEVEEPVLACLWVYEQSARDGSPIHVGQLPLRLLP